ncbi:MAG: HAMP domain-containing sensor histidine kinase [Acidobacteriota bacterium]
MRSFRRLLVLLAVSWLLAAWGGGLEGLPLWIFRTGLLVGAAALAARWVLGPWREFQAAAERLTRGDFAARLDDVSSGDLAPAGKAFNQMAEAFSRSLSLAREREERLAAVLDASDRAIFLLDREGRVLLANPSTQTLFPRFDREVGLASLGLAGLASLVEDARTTRTLQRRTFEEKERGRGRSFIAQATPLERDVVVVYLRDRTAEAALERVKADLVANVSHELRTPLTALASLAELLQDDTLPAERRRHFLERLEHQVRRMARLVDDLLTLSRLEETGAVEASAPLALGPFVEELVRSLEPLAARADVALQASVAEGLRVTADATTLEAALKNLMDNAIRYNRPGGWVRVSAEAEDGAWVRLTVSDSGEGIPARHLSRIFERFYRVDPHRSREKGGTGLGLAIAKHAAQKLGGEIAVESTVGEGTTFTLRVPRVSIQEEGPGSR